MAPLCCSPGLPIPFRVCGMCGRTRVTAAPTSTPWALEATGITVEVAQRRDGGFRSTWARVGAPPPAVPQFAVVPRRWVVERTFAWLGRCRRLSKEYEYLRVCSENAMYLSMARLLVRRLARSAH
ncbi:transposase [Streptomyces phaeochromogenes]|uniref:transposase n=1 Tax=Streptomyces phaeochromogenes TaxID=1923 RepID=UPI00398CD737